MSQVYSTRFFGLQGLSGSESYTVPDGYVASIKHIDIYANPGTFSACTFNFIGNASNTIYWVSFSGTAAQPYAWWDGTAVFYPGETMTVESSFHPCDVQVSGYLLTLP